jgi:hypothetical protein
MAHILNNYFGSVFRKKSITNIARPKRQEFRSNWIKASFSKKQSGKSLVHSAKYSLCQWRRNEDQRTEGCS